MDHGAGVRATVELWQPASQRSGECWIGRGRGTWRPAQQHRGERIRAGFGRAKGRDALRRQQGQRRVGLGREKGRQRLAGIDRGPRDRLNRQLRVELRRGASHRQYRVAEIGGQQAAQHRLVTGRCGRQGQVDDRCGAQRDPLGGHVGDETGGGADHLDAAKSQRIDDHRGAAAGGADHRHSRRAGALGGARGRPRPHQQRRDFQQRLEQLHAHDAVFAKKRIAGGVRSGQRSGVRHRQLRAHLGAAELEHRDRLARPVGGTRRIGQCRRITQRLEEQQDDVGLRIVDQQPGDLAHRQVALVAHRDHAREPESAGLASREDRAQHRAALGHERHPPGRERVAGQGRVDRQGHLARDIDHADAVGPQQAHAQFAGPCHQRLLHRLAFRARFGEAVAVHRDHRDTLAGAAFEGRQHALGGHHDQRVIDGTGDGLDAREGRLAQDLSATWIDRVERSAVTMLAQIDLRAGGVLGGVGRGADQGDRARLEQGPGQRMGERHDRFGRDR